MKDQYIVLSQGKACFVEPEDACILTCRWEKAAFHTLELDAKDLDDAVSLTFDGTHYHLGVHIADVANYVQEKSVLDREAFARGTSVYLADRVIPMLPQRLSNGICSLNAGEDRLAMSVLMEIDEKGTILSHEIVESVIRVDRRMSYT